MKNRYEDPTQRLQSHGWSEEYKENYEKIFGKKETWLERRERERLAPPSIRLELDLDDNSPD